MAFSTPKASSILILLALAVTTVTANGLCVQRAKNGPCFVCYKSKPNQSTGECGPVIGGTCLQYFNNDCQICQRGYYSGRRPGAQNLECIQDPNYIQNCFSELLDKGRKECAFCNGGYPNLNTGRGSCIPFGGSKNIPNCLVGRSNPQAIACYRCQNGYTYDYVRKQCVSVSSLSGCLSFLTLGNLKICTGCNVYEGYSMNKNTDCIRL